VFVNLELGRMAIRQTNEKILKSRSGSSNAGDMNIEFDYDKLAEAIARQLPKGATAPAPPSRYYAVTTVAERLDCSYKHVRNLIDAGELEAVNLGLGEKRMLAITHESLEKLLSRRAVNQG